MEFLTIPELRKEYRGCTECGLCEERNNVVHGRGNKRARVLIVGEAPGENEDQEGIPFVGPSGRLLDWMLVKAGSSREEVWVTNAVLCRPTILERGRLENRAPTNQEIAACQERLHQEIIEIDPDIIILMGGGAIRTLYGTRHPNIGDMVGRMYETDIPCPEGFQARYSSMVLYHPSYLLRVDAARDENGPTVQTVDMMRNAFQMSDFLQLLRSQPENALSEEPDLPDRGRTMTALGEL